MHILQGRAEKGQEKVEIKTQKKTHLARKDGRKRNKKSTCIYN